jgi:hypothetical protein
MAESSSSILRLDPCNAWTQNSGGLFCGVRWDAPRCIVCGKRHWSTQQWRWYLYPMLLRRVAFPDFCEPCLPSPAAKPPAGAGWLHEIKHDGFRMLKIVPDRWRGRGLRRRRSASVRPVARDCVELCDDHHTLPPLLFVAPPSFGGLTKGPVIRSCATSATARTMSSRAMFGG